MLLGVGACSVNVDRPPPEPTWSNFESYSRPTYFHGLDQTFTITKDPRGMWVATDPLGVTSPLDEVEARNRRAWHLRHGALSPALEAHIDPFGDDAPRSVMVAVDESTATRKAEVIEAIQRQGGALGYVTEQTPLLFAEVKPSKLRELAFHPAIRRIVSAHGGTPVQAQSPGGGTVIDPVVHFGLGQLHEDGIDGSGIKVGIIDTGNCLPDVEHDFGSITVFGDTQERACTSSPNCEDLCDDRSSACVTLPSGNGVCREVHGTSVASVVSRVAPGAEIFYANTPALFIADTLEGEVSIFDTACSPAGTVAAYDGFSARDVDLAVQSYGCKNFDATFFGPDEANGIIEDIFASDGNQASVAGMLTFKAAGNDRTVVGRDSSTWACTNQMNSLCVGAHNLSNEVTCCSSFRNPGDAAWRQTIGRPDEFGAPRATDREEPDLLLLSGAGRDVVREGQICPPATSFILASTTDGFNVPFSGTSASTPLAAGLAALWLGGCPESLGFRPGLWLRNWMMFQSLINADGWRYSTPSEPGGDPDLDHGDGAGIFAQIPSEECGGPSAPIDDTPRISDTSDSYVDPQTSGTPTDDPASPFPAFETNIPVTPPAKVPLSPSRGTSSRSLPKAATGTTSTKPSLRRREHACARLSAGTAARTSPTPPEVDAPASITTSSFSGSATSPNSSTRREALMTTMKALTSNSTKRASTESTSCGPMQSPHAGKNQRRLCGASSVKTAANNIRLMVRTAAFALVVAACSDEVMVEEPPPCSEYGDDDEACLEAGCEPGWDTEAPPNPLGPFDAGPLLQICHQMCQSDADCPSSQSCRPEGVTDAAAITAEYICQSE
ncbi:MAG: S8 family serine peptidase [Myxococcota bacterium]